VGFRQWLLGQGVEGTAQEVRGEWARRQ